ncbi:glycosyltransferase family 4 protein [Thalassospira lucentensis]|uniref:glycosyltransferase family 4 protein n=1 Tax=Thalassospira lucentensis TaxID=168935 RepID=UPI00399D598E
MKVLHIVAGNLSGGAARGAYWLHLAQRKLGIDSKLLTDTGVGVSSNAVVTFRRTPFERVKILLLGRLEKLLIRIYQDRKPWIFNLGIVGSDFTKHPEYKAADVIHLHWVNGFVATRTLRKIKKPIIWTMRDMWPLTGGCHYAIGCERYKVGCGSCPQLGSRRKWDISSLVVAHKRYSLPKHLQVVGISRWISEIASESRVFENFSVQTISNNIDTQLFTPIARDVARNVLGFPSKKKIILVGALNINDFYKGFPLFVEALQYLSTEELHVVTFGEDTGSVISDHGISNTSLGFLADTISLRLAYSAADVFIAPSTMEAFGKTLVEAMACATPVVCFDASGTKEIVEHQVTGYKARPFDAEHLATGIKWVLEQSEIKYSELCDNARRRAVENFDSIVAAGKYQELYKKMLVDEKNIK